MRITATKQSDPYAWIWAYESLIDFIRDGYSMCLSEYTNDLACRDFLEDNRDRPEVASFWTRVEAADALLRPLLVPVGQCFRGNYPESRFWYWGYPPDSPELEEDLRSRGVL